MTEQQYKRASKKVFLVVAIVYGYVILTMLAYLGANKDASVGKTILQLITAAAVIAGIVIVADEDDTPDSN